LRSLVGAVCGPTKSRYERVLLAAGDTSTERNFDPERFKVSRDLEQADVLLIDDMWTTGSNAESAACALKAANAGKVAGVTIGRFINRDYMGHGELLDKLPRPFRWETCAVHRP
jgi:3-isopropylmalate dehydratase small subunit